jgi:hypothetical protein
LDINGGLPLSVEDLYIIDNGGSVSGTTVTDADLNGIAKTELTLRINQGLDLPQFDIYNPDPAAVYPDNVLSGASKAIGMVTDDEEGVKVSSIEIQFDGDPNPWESVDTKIGSGLAVRWEHSLSSLAEGPHTLQLRAEDIYGAQGLSNPVDFSIDNDAPVVEIDSPSLGEYLNTTSYTITGTTMGSDVVSVEVTLVDEEDNVTGGSATSTSGVYATWEYDVAPPDSPEGIVAIKAKATDGSGKVAFYNLQVIVDTDFPVVAFLSPTKSTSVNGPVTVRGASSDNRQITKVELRIGKPDNWINLPDLYNWEYLFDSAVCGNTTYADETPAGSNIWTLNINARITDIAGNVIETTDGQYFIYIDQELDKPTVNIISPPAGTTSVGGPLLISGTALDDDGLDRVEMQINVNGDGIHAGDGNFTDQIDFWDGVSKNTDGDTDDYFEKEGTWYTVSGTSLWSQEINNYGEMYNIAGGDGYIIVRVRAVDINGTVGDYKEFYIHLDDLIPRIESLNISSGDFVKGQFNITGKALDDDSIKQIFISYDGGINYEPLSSSYYVMNSQKDYDLDIPINTTDSGSTTPKLDIDSSILYLRLKITDFSNYQSITTLNLNVDNHYPTGDIPQPYSDELKDINGMAARVQGIALDGGTVSGIEKIEVYFVDGVDGVTVYNPTTGATHAPVGTYNFGGGDVDYPTGFAGSENYKIVIDDTNEFGNDSGGNGDGDGFDESLTLAASTYNWWAEFNSNVIPDGKLEVHYVIFDNSGNGAHYELDDGFVKNHKPVINAVIVGSDVDNSGSVEADEQFTYTGPFTARNRLYIEIDASDNDTLTSANYEISHDTPPLVLNDSSRTIDITPAQGYSDGATSFICKVTDPDDISTETTINVTIENTDSVPPVITIDPLTQSDVVAGHLEDVNSLHSGSDPDVSGTVNLTGTASDNQRIQSITVQIDDFDAGSGAGVEHTVASWSGGTLVSVDGDFTIDSQTLTEAGGHQISWTYTWNSADITGAVKDDLNMQFKALDFNPNTDTDSTVVDVVPYISDISRTLPTQRSKYGNFQVQQGESNVIIHGYNLDDSGTHWIRVHNTAGGDPDAGLWDNITMPATGSPFTSMTVDLSGVTHSGWLRLMVNGVEAINNGNDNSLTANKEDDGSGIANTKWTDDRYLRVWQVGDTFQGSGGAQYPSMSIMADGTLYGAWINYATSLLTYGTTSAAPVTQWGTYDPPEYTDMHVDTSEGSLKYAIAFAANHYGGTGDWGNEPLEAANAGFLGVRTPNSRQVDRSRADAYAYPIESLTLNQQLWQFARPKVVRSNGGASDAQDRIHVAYYDTRTTAAKYSFMYDDGQATARGWLNLDGGTDAEDVRYVTGIATGRTNSTVTDPALVGNTLVDLGQTIMLMSPTGANPISYYRTITGFNSGTGVVTFASTGETSRTHYTIVTGTSNLVTAGVTRSTSAGEYVAIDVDEDGFPVVVYYNTAAQTLRLARANKVNPTAPADWTRQNVFAGGDPNAMFSGQHVAMKFDVNGNLHVVCYRSSAGDLLYLYAPDSDGTDYIFQNSVVVDSEGAVGTSPDITLNGTTPYISYLNNSMIGTFEGLKMAYYDGGLGDWEYEIVPVSTAVNDSRTSLEYRKGAVPWLIAMGYSSSSFDIVYLKPEE